MEIDPTGMSEERILQLIKESLKSAKSVEYKNTVQAQELLQQAIELARKERFTKESFLEACTEVLMSLYPEGNQHDEKRLRDVFYEGLEAGLTLDYCYERCLQGLDELVKSDPSSEPRMRELRLLARKVYIEMSLEELHEL
jgi:hypothetical protein